MKKTTKHKAAAVALIETQLIHFTPDRFGHYKTADGKYRLKMQATSIRFERKAGDVWHNLKSTYYTKFALADVDYIQRRTALASSK